MLEGVQRQHDGWGGIECPKQRRPLSRSATFQSLPTNASNGSRDGQSPSEQRSFQKGSEGYLALAMKDGYGPRTPVLPEAVRWGAIRLIATSTAAICNGRFTSIRDVAQTSQMPKNRSLPEGAPNGSIDPLPPSRLVSVRKEWTHEQSLRHMGRPGLCWARATTRGAQ